MLAWAPAVWALVLCAGCSDSQPPSATGPARSSSSSDRSTLASSGWYGAASGFNVLVVTFDTVRADAVGCYGDPRAKTPNVDRLAATGVRYERAIAPAPTTLPSHSTLFTGLEPPSHGVHNNGTFRLAPERTTLAEILGPKGYATCAMIAAFVLDERYGLAQGFERYDDDLHLDGSPAGEGHFVQRSAERVTDGALAWLAQHGEAPFFLWTHYFDAHAPYQAPAPFAPDASGRDPRAPMDPAFHRRQYLAEVSYADAQLGRLLDALGSARLERTLVVFTADHGEGLGEHGEFTHSRLIYEGSLRIPLILSNPRLFSGAQVERSRIAGLVDVTPTVLALLGIDSELAFDGRALLGTPADPERAIYSESLVTLFNHGWAPLYSYTRLHDKFISAPRPEYYDLSSDSGEQRNLFAPSQPQALALSRAMKERLSKLKPLAREAEGVLSPDDSKRLAELGYSRSIPSTPAAGALDPKDAIMTWAVLTNARAYADQGQFERALADVAAVLKSNPNDAYAWETSYVIHLRRRAWPDAEASVRRVLELNPSGDGYVRLAKLLIEQGKLDECDPVLSEGEAREPRNGELMLARGDYLVLRQRFDEARAKFLEAIEVDPVRASEGARRGLAYLDEHAPKH